MSFNDDVRLDTSQVTSGGRGGAPGKIAVGGGIGGLIILVIAVIFGISPGDIGVDPGTGGLDPGQVDGEGGQSSADFAECRSGADANANDTCRVIATVNSVQAFWTDDLRRYKLTWNPTKTVLYTGSTRSACGTASNEVGPFYCPLDKKVYLDASFFELLTQRFGADGGALAQEYVVAHEYGHALQDQLGLLGKAQQDPQGPQSGSVRTELMADCLAGVWAKNATETTDATGTPFLEPLTERDIASALSAAKAVGDDTIQGSGGVVTPETWTHGSAKARQTWFLTGYRSGDLNQCDTFSVANVE